VDCCSYHKRVIGQEIPRIGLTTYRERSRWGVWDEPADLLPATYARAVEAAGALPVLLPPADPALVPAALRGLDGLVLAGGADVDPARYAADRHVRTGEARPDRDGWEIALAEAALDRQLPLLGICRGMQVLNVALGGDLVQHLPDVVGTDDHCPTPGAHGRHHVRLTPESRLARAIGSSVEVATYHHQAVDRLGRGLVAVGWADDGTVEAVELPDARWAAGVQWHPEAHAGETLFAAFSAAAGAAA
jgi:putative glutamine amidotransferase